MIDHNLLRTSPNFLSVLLAFVFILMGTQAWAHTTLKTSYPARNAVLDMPPEQIVLTYKGPVQLLKVSIRNVESDQVMDVKVADKRTLTEHHELPAPQLGPGTYRLSWKALGKDTHKLKGKFDFIIDASP